MKNDLNKKSTKENEDKKVKNENTKEEKVKSEIKTKAESIYKCSNCGASLESFTSNCPYCRAEIRNIISSESVKKFAEGLEKIKAKEMPKYEGKESLMKKAIGIDLSKDIETREEFRNNFKDKINDEVANYIKNYPVPNSKEDLIEFMILVTSNINSKSDDSDEIKKAWESKMEQIYKKSKLTLKKQSDMNIIEDLYNSKKQELKNNKIDIGFYISIGICLYIGLMITIENLMFGLAFIFFSLGIVTLLYHSLKGDSTNLFKTPIILTRKLVKIISIILFGISLTFIVLGVIKLNTHTDGYNDYYNDTIKKNNVEVEIDFEGNLLFNKYDIKLSVYDQEVNLEHGKNKTVNLKLPDGKHRLEFTGDGMIEYIDLEVKGNTSVKYKISCYSDEIKVSELETKYNND